jgi:PPOX class probable F420-dependent enzyme
MEIADALEFAKSTHNGVLVTVKRNGRPQLSNISHAVGDDGIIRISITADRAKYANLRRDPRGSVYVSSPDFWAYAVIEGDVKLSPIAADPKDATVEELIELYRAVQGEHPNWDEYRAAMVQDKRTVVHLTPTHVYGALGG